MNKPAAKRRGQPALQLLEEAVGLLRRAPPMVFVAHLLGSAPCLLFGLFFFTDLSRSPFAADRLISSSLTFALLYGWMKCWQAVGVAHLNAALLGKDAPAWDAGRLARLVAAQILIHPFGLVLRLIGGTLVIPYVWTAVWCQNVSVLGDGTPAGVREVAARAFREALRWPLAAHGLASQLLLFGIFIYINVLSFLATVPFLLKTFFGLETIFSRYMLGLFNPTVLLAVLALTYLVLDPIRKAAVMLRCFHGRSLRTGEDLAVEMQRVRRASPARVLALALALFLLHPGASPVRAEPAPIEAAQLDRSIDSVLDRPEYTWRAARPRDGATDPAKMTAFQRWLRDARAWAQRVSWKLGRAVRHWLDSLFRRPIGDRSSGDSAGWMTSAQALLWTALAVTVAVLAVLIVRRWRQARPLAATAEAMAAAPDLREEDVTADQLPEDRWLRLAAELFERGELRLALRAFYLAGLAHLGARDLLHLARHKSNRDYAQELRRRARTQGELQAAFGRNLDAFERVWYGDHAVTSEAIGEVAANLERIRAC